MKYIINPKNEKYNKECQKLLFNVGYTWYSGRIIQHPEDMIAFCSAGFNLCHTQDLKLHLDVGYKLITLTDLKRIIRNGEL